MLRVQKINGEVAAKNIPRASHGRNSNQHNAVIMMANENANNIFPYNGCCGFGSMRANKRISPKTTLKKSDVHVTEKNNKTNPMNLNAHACIFRS